MTIEIETPPESAGERLDVFLAAQAAVGSRSAAQRAIAAGRVTVDGLEVGKSHRLAAGETVAIAPELSPRLSSGSSPGKQAPYLVAWEDEHLMVVDKPAGVVVHPAPGNETGTLSQALAAAGAAGGDPWRPGIVHRLDKGTSGLLLVAKSQQVLTRLQEALRDRRVERHYMALVRGRPASLAGTVDAPIGRDRSQRTRMALGAAASRGAVTHFETAEEMGRATLLRLKLDTGRTHQIRVHLAAIGLPVCGDTEYGEDGAYGLSRQFLHACRLCFDHPVTGARVEVESPLPDDLIDALARARAESA